MTDLHVRDVDPEVVSALKALAARQGRSVSQVHREILEQALRPRKQSLAEHLWRCRKPYATRISGASTSRRAMYLIDTNVVSELRKGRRADSGVRAFFEEAAREQVPLFLSVITLAELDAGVTRVRDRGGHEQAAHLAAWLQAIRRDYGSRLLSVDEPVVAQLGPLLAHGRGGTVDRIIMATALAHGLTVVTPNIRDFAAVATHNPFRLP